MDESSRLVTCLKELIYGVKMHGDSKLFSSQGPIVNEKRSYGSVGAGYYMADFLATIRDYRRILSEAKEPLQSWQRGRRC